MSAGAFAHRLKRHQVLVAPFHPGTVEAAGSCPYRRYYGIFEIRCALFERCVREPCRESIVKHQIAALLENE
jgi:hypothetical protein